MELYCLPGPARPSKRIQPLALRSKQLARPTIPTPEPDPDPSVPGSGWSVRRRYRRSWRHLWILIWMQRRPCSTRARWCISALNISVRLSLTLPIDHCAPETCEGAGRLTCRATAGSAFHRDHRRCLMPLREPAAAIPLPSSRSTGSTGSPHATCPHLRPAPRPSTRMIRRFCTFGADVDTARWLIEKQESRTVQHGASQQDFLLVPAAQR